MKKFFTMLILVFCMAMCVTPVFAASKTYKKHNAYNHYEITKKKKKRVKKLKQHSFNNQGVCKKCGYSIPDAHVRITLRGKVVTGYGRYSRRNLEKVKKESSRRLYAFSFDRKISDIVMETFGPSYTKIKKNFHLEICSCSIKNGKYEIQGFLERHTYINGKCHFCGKKA